MVLPHHSGRDVFTVFERASALPLPHGGTWVGCSHIWRRNGGCCRDRGAEPICGGGHVPAQHAADGACCDGGGRANLGGLLAPGHEPLHRRGAGGRPVAGGQPDPYKRLDPGGRPHHTSRSNPAHLPLAVVMVGSHRRSGQFGEPGGDLLPGSRPRNAWYHHHLHWALCPRDASGGGGGGRLSRGRLPQ